MTTMKTMMKFFLQLMQMASPPWRSPRCSTVFSSRIMRTNQDNKVETIFILHNFSTQIISPLWILFSGGSLIISGLNPDLQSFMWRFCPLLNEFSCFFNKLLSCYHTCRNFTAPGREISNNVLPVLKVSATILHWQLHFVFKWLLLFTASLLSWI